MWCLHIICTYTCVFVSAHLHSFYVREKVCLHVCQGDVMAADVQLNCGSVSCMNMERNVCTHTGTEYSSNGCMHYIYCILYSSPLQKIDDFLSKTCLHAVDQKHVCMCATPVRNIRCLYIRR